MKKAPLESGAAGAALDPQSQDKLMELLSKQPEHTTLLSVGHRPELEQDRSRTPRGGAKLVSDIKLIRKPQTSRQDATVGCAIETRGWMRRKWLDKS